MLEGDDSSAMEHLSSLKHLSKRSKAWSDRGHAEIASWLSLALALYGTTLRDELQKANTVQGDRCRNKLSLMGGQLLELERIGCTVDKTEPDTEAGRLRAEPPPCPACALCDTCRGIEKRLGHAEGNAAVRP